MFSCIVHKLLFSVMQHPRAWNLGKLLNEFVEIGGRLLAGNSNVSESISLF